ncbi:MAG: TPM domain-containing protein, partial [Clostridium sp.]|nr:TPM domain-containing protein [Clostridium sp.]
MKRRILSVLLCVTLALLLAVPAHAADSQPRILDKADLLTAEEEAVLEEASYQFCVENSLDAVILTVNDLGGKSISTFAEDWYDQNGYGVGTDSSGLILVVSMAERELYISTCGEAINRLNDRELDSVIGEISYDL